MKANPNRRNPGSRKNRRKPNRSSLPPELRAKGIGTQRQLVMRLLPYMEWIRYEGLRTVFWKYITDHQHDGPLRSILHNLHKEGLIEKTYRGTPPATPKNLHNMKMKLCKYLYVRRISKTCPDTAATAKKLDGTYGFDAAKRRARRQYAKPRKPKKSMLTLTVEDWHYIREQRGKMPVRVLAEMFNQHMDKIQKILHGHKPAHLKAQLSQSHFADSQADI